LNEVFDEERIRTEIASDPNLLLTGNSFEDLPQKVEPLVDSLNCDGKL